MLDVFKSDAFSMVSMTDAILKAPFQPGRLGALNLFGSRGITTTTVVVEEKDGRLELIADSPRGGPSTTIGAKKRTARSFRVLHLEKESRVLADEVQGIRAFGQETQAETVQQLVAERMIDLRAFHEVTLEHLRIGALKGQILDADGTTVLFNLFTEFGVSQQTHDIDLGTEDVRTECINIQRLIENELGGEPTTGYHAFCGNTFYDALRNDTGVKESLKYQESAQLRDDARTFKFGGITWENYRGSVGAVAFVPTAEAYVFPLGTQIFRNYWAPADFVETVNTLGQALYAKVVADERLNRYVDIHTQSNPLALCLRPRAVIKVTQS